MAVTQTQPRNRTNHTLIPNGRFLSNPSLPRTPHEIYAPAGHHFRHNAPESNENLFKPDISPARSPLISWPLMARPRNHKRKRTDELWQESSTRHDPPAKKTKTRSEIELNTWTSWKYPPEFWDRLSKIWLTRRALEELDRRTVTRRSHLSPPAGPGESVQHLSPITTSRDLARFARHGGPNLCDLRGYPEPKRNRPISGVMSSSQSLRSRRTKSTDPSSTLPTSATTKTKKSTPYDRSFDLHLTDHHVHATYSSQKPDLAEVRKTLEIARPSLSPSRFSDGAFETFQENNARAKDEDDVLADVIPIILGPKQADHASARNTVFGNLEQLTDGTIAPAKPDIYYGAYPEELSRAVRDELDHYIMPSTMQDKPMVPSFFLEAKGPDGSAAVALRQARYDGAIGARAMHSLQNYGEEEPVYDDNAYTFSSTYHDGTLKMYAHHPTAPANPGGRPEYHMTQIDGWQMTGKRKTFIEGATSFRNARDLAQKHRDRFIRAANARAQRGASCPQHNIIGTAGLQEAGDEEFAESQDVEGGLPFSSLQQDNNLSISQDVNEDTALPQYVYREDDQQDDSQASLSVDATDQQASIVTSFTSSFTSGNDGNSFRTGSKRAKAARSPPTNSHHRRKLHRTTEAPHPTTSKDRGSSEPVNPVKGKAKASSSNMSDGNGWQWDDQLQAYKV